MKVQRGLMHRILVVPLLLLPVLLLLPGVISQEEAPVVYTDFRALMDTYGRENWTFSGLSEGDTVEFIDVIETVSVGEEGGRAETWLYFASAGTSQYGPKLEIPKDVSGDLKEGMRVKVTAEISVVKMNGTPRQVLNAPVRSVEVLKETKPDGRDLEVFGIKIRIDLIPSEYRTSFVKFLLVFIVWALGTFVLWVVFRMVLKMIARTKTGLDRKIVKIVKNPLLVIVLLYGLLVSLAQLDPPHRVIRFLELVYNVATIVLVSYVVIRIFKNVVMVYLKILSEKTETQADDVLVPILGNLVTFVVWIIASLLLLQAIGVDVTVFLAGAGVLGLVLAFAAQDTLSNFFSGIMIMLDRPFKEGDWIKLDDKIYQVTKIGLRSTRLLHSTTNQLVTIPNNRISDHLFSNLSEPDILGRTTVGVGVSYEANPKEVGKLLLEIARTHTDIFEDKDHIPYYRFTSFGDSTLEMTLTFWVRDFNDQWRVESEVREQIIERFAEEGIRIPYPQSVVYVKKER